MKIIELDNANLFAEVKNDIESKLIENGTIDSKMSIPEFIDMLKMENSIYIKDDIVVPFRIYDDYLFIIGSNSIIEKVTESLESIEYDLSKLKEVSMEDVHNGKLDNYEHYFIIESKYMIPVE